MKGIWMGKGIVMRINLTSGLFGYKTRCSCVCNKTACDIACKLMRWWFIESVGCVVSRDDTSYNSILD